MRALDRVTEDPIAAARLDALEDAQQRLALAQAAGGAGFFEWNLAAGTARVSGVLSALLAGPGAGEIEVPIERWAACVHPDDDARVRRQVEAAIVAGDVRLAYEFRVRTPEGERWLSANAEIRRDAQGRALGLLGVNVDVTERRRAEERLREAEARARGEAERARHYLRVAGTVLLVLDARGRIETINRAGCELLGRDEASLLGRDWFEVALRPEHREAVRAEYLELMAGRREPVTAYENPVLRADGTLRQVAWRNAVLHDADGTFAGTVSSGEDVTERRAQERALRDADSRKDDFLAMLGHELRNPLAALTNALRIVDRTARLDARPAGALAMARRQAVQIGRLVDDLLDASRIRRGTLRLVREPLPLGAAVRAAIEAGAADCAAAGHAVHVDVRDGDARLDADPARVAQMLGNLIGNACKFTPAGGRIDVSARVDAGFGEIRVADTGIGLEPEALARVFELFVQVDPRPDRGHGGLGIGLALARRLAELHGGSMAASSDGPGRGATFVLRLPLAAA